MEHHIDDHLGVVARCTVQNKMLYLKSHQYQLFLSQCEGLKDYSFYLYFIVEITVILFSFKILEAFAILQL